MSRYLTSLLLCLLVAPAAFAKTIVEIRQDGVLVRRQVIGDAKGGGDADSPKLAPWLAKGAMVSAETTWIVPGFRIDDSTPAGDSTFFSIRNARNNDADVNVTIEYFAEDNTFLDDEEVVIPGNETLSVNTRDNPLLVDLGGVSTGYIVIEANGPLGVDAFQVDFSENFATGGLAPRLVDFCFSWLARFLTFGGDSGSQLVVLLSAPLGAENATPTIEGEVFSEAGMSINTFAIFTGEYLLELDAQDLVVGDTSFGSMEITVNLDAPLPYPSFVSLKHSAFEKFSVGAPAVCTGQVMFLTGN